MFTFRDAFASIKAAQARDASVPVTAAGGGDNTLVNCNAIDLSLLAKVEQSVALVLTGVTTLASTQTLKFTANWQEASDSGFTQNVQIVPDSEQISTPTTVRTGVTTAGSFYLILPLNLQLVTPARGFVRARFTPDLSAGGTDTATIFATYLFGVPQTTPVNKFGNVLA